MCVFLQMVVYVKEEMKRNQLQEQAVIGLLWTCLMNAVEWNKKEELVTEQAIKHLKVTDGHSAHLKTCVAAAVNHTWKWVLGRKKNNNEIRKKIQAAAGFELSKEDNRFTNQEPIPSTHTLQKYWKI